MAAGERDLRVTCLYVVSTTLENVMSVIGGRDGTRTLLWTAFSVSGVHNSNNRTYGGPCLAGGGEAEPTAAASAAAADTMNGIDEEADESNSKMPKSGQGGNDNDDDGDNTLWEQMTAREGRDAARRAGMSVGDWQAERQLQEALRESVQVSSSVAAAIGFFVAYWYNH